MHISVKIFHRLCISLSFVFLLTLLNSCGVGIAPNSQTILLPTVERVAASSGLYTLGQAIQIEITFSQVVFVSGIPQLSLRVGSANRVATYRSGSGGRVLTFTYTVQTGDAITALDYTSTSALQPNGGAISNSLGVGAILNLPALGSANSIAGVATIVVDTIGASSPTGFGGTGANEKNLLSWSDGGSDTAGFIIVRRPSTAVVWEPTAGTAYTVSQDLGSSQTVIYRGTNTSAIDTSLTNNTLYHYTIFAFDSAFNYSAGATTSSTPAAIWAQEAYVKSANHEANDWFGYGLAIQSDTLVVGAAGEDSSQMTITNGTTASADNSLLGSGAIFIYKRTGTAWAQEAYIKAPNPDIADSFGSVAALDTDTIVVGAYGESSSQTTITNGTTASGDNGANQAGAAYVFKRTGTAWAQEAYLKAPNADVGDSFGNSVAISGDTIVVGAYHEQSSETTITNGPPIGSDNTANQAGAAYVYKRSGTAWSIEAYLKAANAQASDLFGRSVSITGDTIVVGATDEDSNDTTITNGTTASADNSANQAGAAYVFKRTGTTWAQEAFLKAPNARTNYGFGISVAVADDTIVVGSSGEASNQTTITNGTTASADNSAAGAGAAYVFKRTGSNWAQEAYLKAPNTDAGDNFGWSVALSGNTVVVGAIGEASNQTTITNGSTASVDNSASQAGAAYVFQRTGTTWAMEAYLKAPNTQSGDWMGGQVSINEDTIAVTAFYESSNQTTITNGATASSDNSAANAGAVYIFKR